MRKPKTLLSILLTAAVATGTLVSAPAALAAPVPTTSTALAFTKLPSNPVIAAQKTARGKTIQDLAIQNGEIYTGYGDYAANTGPIQVTSMNINTQVFKNWVSTPNEEINNYREINGKLYTPQIDPRLAWNANVGYATNASGKWVNQNVTPFIHVFDVATSDGKDLWLAGSASLADGKTPDGAAIKRSTDGGKTWTTVKRATSFNGADAAEYDRYYWLAAVNGKIYTKAAVTATAGTTNPLEVWENGSWSTVADPTSIIKDYVDARQVAVFKNKVYFGGGRGVATLNSADNSFTVNSSYPLAGAIDFYVQGDTLYAMNYDGVASTTDGEKWKILTNTLPDYRTESGFSPSSIAVDPATDKLFIAGTNASVYVADNISKAAPLTPPVIAGVKTVVVASEDIFNPLDGVTATDSVDGDITSKISYTSNIRDSIPGKYTVTYSVVNSTNVKTSISRQVVITPADSPSAPKIAGANDTTSWIEYSPTDEFFMQNVEGLDTIDGNITNKIVVNNKADLTKAGTYTVTYTLTNSNDLTTVINRTIKVRSLAPTFTGTDSATVDAGTSFDPLKDVTASDVFTGNVTNKIVVTGAVDTTKAGTYTLTYTADGGFGYVGKTTRVVTVKANPATIAGADSVTVNSGSKFDVKSGVTASDTVDGDLTANITVTGTVNTTKIGTYKLVYTVNNSNGQTSTVERVVTVKKAAKPTLAGATAVSVPFGGVFDPLAGVTSVDAVDGDLKSKIVVNGTVDTMKSGRYILKYQVTNSGNITTYVTRYVTVKAAAKSTITGATAARIQFGSTFDPLAGVTASDPYDGDVTSRIVVTGAIDSMKSGIQRVTYKVTNTGNVTTTVTRQVTVVKNAAPVFSTAQTVYKKNTPYDPATAITASDAEDGPLTNVTYTTNVNMTKAGKYVTTYTAVDRFGAKTVKKVTITVTN